MQGTKEYTYYDVAVEPAFGANQYYYLADEEYQLGEYVMVPFGRKQKILLGIVSEIKHCTEDNAPYPPEKTKKILHRATDDEIRGEPEPGEEIDDTDDSSWTGKTPIQVRCNETSIVVSPLELKILHWIEANQDPRPLRNVQRRYPKYSPKAVEDAMEHLLSMGILYGGKNFAMNIYFPTGDIQIKEPGARSRAFAKLETIFQNASQEEIEQQAIESASVLDELLGRSGLEDTISAILIVAKYGTGHNGELTEREKHLVHVLLDDDDNTADAERACLFMGSILLDNAFAVVQHLSTDILVGMDTLLLALSFAYIDGGLDDETAQNLNGLFHEATLEAVMGAMQIGKEKHGTQEDECHIAENHVAQHQTISGSNIPAGKADVENLQADKAIQDKPSKASEVKKESANPVQRQEEPPKLTKDEERARYQSELKRWQTKCSKIRSQRREMVDAQLREEQGKLEDMVKKESNAEILSYQEEMKKHLAQKEDAERELASLGVFKFSEKKAKKTQIENAKNKIAETQTRIEQVKQRCKAEIAEAKDKAQKRKAEFRSEAEKKFPLPCEPQKPDFIQKEEAAEKARVERTTAISDRIVAEMDPNKSYTLSDMMQFKCLRGMDLTTAKVRAFLDAPIEANRVLKGTLKGRVVFFLNTK